MKKKYTEEMYKLSTTMHNKLLTLLSVIFLMVLLISCGMERRRDDNTSKNTSREQRSKSPKNRTTRSAQYLSGTYVPINEMASTMKMEFSGNKVQFYIIWMDMAFPTAGECTYTLNGNKLIIKEILNGNEKKLELNYNKSKDQISLNADYAWDMIGGLATAMGNMNGKKIDGKEISNKLKQGLGDPIWGREGTNDCLLLFPPQDDLSPKTVLVGNKYTLRWKPVECATRYIVHWSFYGYDGNKKSEGNSEWITRTEWTLDKFPNECGNLYFNIYAGDAYKEGEKSLDISVDVVHKGKLIFLTHGLNDNKGACFQETVKRLAEYDNYYNYGRVSASHISENENKAQYINQFIDVGKNVLVRLEFSEGNLSFTEQLDEMTDMVHIFYGQNADKVIFVGHSMGGLASINYGVKYATYRNNKKVTIITVSTPFNDNNYGKVLGFFGDKAGKDLGGRTSSLSDLKEKWTKYKNCELHTIGIVGSSKGSKENKDKRGDGIIDITTQLGADWEGICSQYTIYRIDGNAKVDWVDVFSPYHHMYTSNLPEIAERINEIVKGNVKCKM